MLTVPELLEAARVRAGLPSHYRLTRVLGVTDNTMSRWRQGRGTPDDALALKLAELAGIDEGEVLAAMQAHRAQDDASRAAWRGIAERLRGAGLGLAAGLAALTFTGGPDGGAHASQVVDLQGKTEASAPGSVYYVNLRFGSSGAQVGLEIGLSRSR